MSDLLIFILTFAIGAGSVFGGVAIYAKIQGLKSEVRTLNRQLERCMPRMHWYRNSPNSFYVFREEDMELHPTHDSRFRNIEEAKEHANELLQLNPGEIFLIFGAHTKMTSSIPTQEESLLTTESA